jgi:chaperonin GroES
MPEYIAITYLTSRYNKLKWEFIMNFKPLYDRIAVIALEQEEKTSGGVIIPDTAKEKPIRGKVVAVGSGSRSENGSLHALEVKVGDEVLYGKWAGTEVKIEGKTLMVMKESDVMGIIA